MPRGGTTGDKNGMEGAAVDGTTEGPDAPTESPIPLHGTTLDEKSVIDRGARADRAGALRRWFHKSGRATGVNSPERMRNGTVFTRADAPRGWGRLVRGVVRARRGHHARSGRISETVRRYAG